MDCGPLEGENQNTAQDKQWIQGARAQKVDFGGSSVVDSAKPGDSPSDCGRAPSGAVTVSVCAVTSRRAAPLYLDYAASAPMSAPALAAEAAYEASEIAGANPNSLHTLGRRAARALDGARRDLVRCLGCGFRPADVAFTSGGTESNNLALFGLAEAWRARDRRRVGIVMSAIEHDSEIDVVPALRDRGFDVILVKPGRDGRITAESVADVVGDDTALVSVMAANNETGVVQPLADIARIAHGAGACMHTDAVQAFGRIPLLLERVDALSIAAHKIGGPVGIGALVVRGGVPLRPQMFGGGQERGKRPGTQSVRAALAFAAAACDCCEHMACRRALVASRAQKLYDRLCADPRCLPTTSAVIDERRLPGMVSIMVAGLDSETLVLSLDQMGFEVSAGSACSSGSLDASHVLVAMGIPRDMALGSLRISFDERVGQEDLARFAGALATIIKDHRLSMPSKTRHKSQAAYRDSQLPVGRESQATPPDTDPSRP